MGRRSGFVLVAALGVATQSSCARPIVYRLSPEPPRSSRDIAIVEASSGRGDERIDITAVDDRRIDDYFGPDHVWIELPPGEHIFQIGLLWTRSSEGAFIAKYAQATLKAGQCYQPMFTPASQPKNWRKRYMVIEVASCPRSWLSRPEVKQASPPPEPG